MSAWGCFYEGGIFTQNNKELLASGIQTEGRIVGFERVGAGREDRLHESYPIPIVEFRTESGMEVRFVGTVAERFWTDHQADNTVQVIYESENPKNAKINEFTEIWFAPAIFLLIGLGAALLPPYTIWRHYKGRVT